MTDTIITAEVARKVLDTVDAGLTDGIGVPVPGHMCVEAAVCYALGLPHGDNPACVSTPLRALKIRLNDSQWSSNIARAAGLRRLAVAQLGSAGVLDQREFVRRLAELAIGTMVPIALRATASTQTNGNYILDSLGDGRLALSRSMFGLFAYVFGPTIILMTPLVLQSGPALAANPSAFSASASAKAADSAGYDKAPTGKVISTSDTDTSVPIVVLPAALVTPAVMDQLTPFQSASISAVSIYCRKSRYSGSLPTVATANCVPACGFSFSAIRYICSRVSILGALNLASSSCASTAVASASAARALASPAALMASASLAFERLRKSVWIRASFLLNKTSPTIPSAITASAMAVPHCSRNESYGGWSAATANSAITAITTAPAHPHSHRSHDDDADSNWLSVAFIAPFGKRHGGKEFRGFWAGAGLTALMFAVLFAVSFLVK